MINRRDFLGRALGVRRLTPGLEQMRLELVLDPVEAGRIQAGAGRVEAAAADGSGRVIIRAKVPLQRHRA